jgi:hypothetical protein
MTGTETVLAAGTAIVVPLVLGYLKYRNEMAKLRMEVTGAGITAAKSQYDIWKEEWGRIIGAMEKRIEGLEAENARLEAAHAIEFTAWAKERMELRMALDLCNSTADKLSDRLRRAGIPNGDKRPDENGNPK